MLYPNPAGPEDGWLDATVSLTLEDEGVMLDVVRGYPLQLGCELEEKQKYWRETDEEMQSRLETGSDFSRRVWRKQEVMEEFKVLGVYCRHRNFSTAALKSR